MLMEIYYWKTTLFLFILLNFIFMNRTLLLVRFSWNISQLLASLYCYLIFVLVVSGLNIEYY